MRLQISLCLHPKMPEEKALSATATERITATETPKAAMALGYKIVKK